MLACAPEWGCTLAYSAPDYDQMEEVARRERPKLIVGGASAYSREWDYARMRRLADEIGAIFMVDMAHQFIGHDRSVFTHLCGIFLEFRRECFAESNGLGCDHMLQRSALALQPSPPVVSKKI